MAVFRYPRAIQCAELTAERESVKVMQQMKGRITDLASISATASLIGFLGTTLSLLLHSFPSFGTSKSTILAVETLRISAAMAPGAIGLLVALLAFWPYCYLSAQLRTFEREMRGVRVQLVNGLLVHLHSLKKSNPAL